jgi:cytochrome c oxidase assembly protein subunit 15
MSRSETRACDHARPSVAVRGWLLALAVLVFLVLSVGGATRLTGSGLSITEWRPIVGILPPLTEADWQQAFAEYQHIPQYQQVNRGMPLKAFKVIFWWEWTHRLLARLLGVVLVVPLVYFLATRQIAASLFAKLACLFGLGALQGAAGWYMVHSGLSGRTEVSQYRLALHLGLAFIIFGALLSMAFARGRGRARPGTGSAALIVLLVFLQILLGALVAGLRAGLSHNTWPLMDGRLIPVGLGVIEPWYRNLFENAMTVQFNHRLAAYLLVLATFWHVWRVAPRTRETPIKLGALALAAAGLAQAGLGILTLLAHVPLPLALAHQAGAAALFALAVWHLQLLRGGG